MSDELRESIVIAVECILFGFLIMVIGLFGTFSRTALNTKTIENATMTDITEFRNLFEFSGGKQVSKESLVNTIGNYPYTDFAKLEQICKKYGNTVKGDDVIRFIGLFSQEYELHIYKLENRKYKELVLDETKTKTEWSISENTKWLGTNIEKDFYCLPVHDDDSEIYDSIIFIEGQL